MADVISPSISVTPLEGGIGAEVSGVDLSQPMDGEAFEAINKGLCAISPSGIPRSGSVGQTADRVQRAVWKARKIPPTLKIRRRVTRRSFGSPTLNARPVTSNRSMTRGINRSRSGRRPGISTARSEHCRRGLLCCTARRFRRKAAIRCLPIRHAPMMRCRKIGASSSMV